MNDQERAALAASAVQHARAIGVRLVVAALLKRLEKDHPGLCVGLQADLDTMMALIEIPEGNGAMIRAEALKAANSLLNDAIA